MRRAIIPLVSLLLFSSPLISMAEKVEAEVKIEVKIFKPQQEPHRVTIELSGTVVAEQDAQLATLEAGLVKALFVEAGDKVVAGQALLSLDDTLARLRLSQEEADHVSALVQQQEAQRQYDEVVSLAKSKVVADSLLAERKANLASAKSQVTSSQARVALQNEIVKRHTLIAPFDGVIAQRNVNLGEWISRQDRVFQLVSDQSVRLIVNLPQEHLSAISIRTEAIVIPDVMPDKHYTLPIASIVPVSEPSSRTLQVRINIPTNSGMLPGMSARARINLSGGSNSSASSGSNSGTSADTDSENTRGTLSWIPRTALKRHPDGSSSVFTVHLENKNIDTTNSLPVKSLATVKRRKITMIKSDMDRVAVTGLPIHSLVVLSGIELLKDNQSVTAISSETDSSETGPGATDPANNDPNKGRQ